MKRVEAYLDDETYAALKAEAKRRDTSISAVGREIFGSDAVRKLESLWQANT